MTEQFVANSSQAFHRNPGGCSTASWLLHGCFNHEYTQFGPLLWDAAYCEDQGRYVQRDGLEYEGEFARGRFEGLGKLSLSRDEGINTSGDCRKGVGIRGSFEGGKVTGVANAVYADGKTYTGELSVCYLL